MKYDLAHRMAALRAWGVGYLDCPRQCRRHVVAGASRSATASASLRSRRAGRLYARASRRSRRRRRGARFMAVPGSEPASVAASPRRRRRHVPGSEHCTLRWHLDEPDHQAIEAAAPGARSWWSRTATRRLVGDDRRRARALLPTNLLVRGS